MSNQISRRQFLWSAGAGVSALALAACVPATLPAAQQDAAPAAEPLKLTVWSSFSGKNGEAETELVKRFNESQSNVVVDYQFQGNYEETAQKVTAALQARTAPDVSLLSDVWWFKFYLSQNLLPLDDLLSAQNIDLADYQDSLINEGVRQGKHYWMPFARSTPLFYYNKEKWAAAGLPDRGPETWDEFVEWAPTLLQKEGDELKVSAFAHPDGASYIAWLFQGVAWQFNGSYSDPDFTMRMTDEATLEAGQFYKNTVHNYGWAVPSKDISSDFINGLTAASMMSTGSMGGIKANATFEFGTAFLPKKYQFGCCTGGAGLAILASTPAEKQEAAMSYIAFVSNPENTTYWAQNTGYMPVRKSALQSEAMQSYFVEFPQFKTATEQLALTRPQDAARVFVPNGDQIIGSALERITVQSDDVAVAFADVNAILESEAQPVLEALRAIEG
ncbi:MAG: ABC transporter substrate-binding protein [Caldilinea sp.]|jgi:sn-glycerol 3-phosphate transport system substrate-binding protein|nr:ABC transporter substrate-binding protein [Caldilinea sp.]